MLARCGLVGASEAAAACCGVAKCFYTMCPQAVSGNYDHSLGRCRRSRSLFQFLEAFMLFPFVGRFSSVRVPPPQECRQNSPPPAPLNNTITSPTSADGHPPTPQQLPQPHCFSFHNSYHRYGPDPPVDRLRRLQHHHHHHQHQHQHHHHHCRCRRRSRSRRCRGCRAADGPESGAVAAALPPLSASQVTPLSSGQLLRFRRSNVGR